MSSSQKTNGHNTYSSEHVVWAIALGVQAQQTESTGSGVDDQVVKVVALNQSSDQRVNPKRTLDLAAGQSSLKQTWNALQKRYSILTVWSKSPVKILLNLFPSRSCHN